MIVQNIVRSPFIEDQGRDVIKCTVCFQITLNWGSEKRQGRDVFKSPLIGGQRRGKEETFSDHSQLGIKKEARLINVQNIVRSPFIGDQRRD